MCRGPNAPMTDKDLLVRELRPGPQALVYYLWDAVAFSAGVGILVFSSGVWIRVIAGLIMCLFGALQFLSTYSVLRTHFVVTDEEILSASPSVCIGLRWREISHVLIRLRPRGMQPGRPDRQVELTGAGGNRLPLNTSVLRQTDESWLLEEIARRVSCPIENVTEGLIPGRPPTGAGA